MALKGNRYIVTTRTEYFMDEVASRGGIASVKTVGSGAALDQSTNLCTYATKGSGAVPLGILLQDMVNVDLTRYKLNQHKDEVQQGGKVCLMDRGWVRTNMLFGTPTSAGPAYVYDSGLITSVSVGAAASPVFGRIESTPDEDGYAKVSVNLPNGFN